MYSNCTVISLAPRFAWRYLPLYYRADCIVLCDTNLLDGFDNSIQKNVFYKWLVKRGFEKKIKVLSANAYDNLYWEANLIAVKYLKIKYTLYRKEDHTVRYFTGYLAHRNISSIARTVFVKKLAQKLAVNGKTKVLKENIFNNIDHSHKLLSIIGFIFSPLFLALNLLVLIKIVLQKTYPVLKSLKRENGGLALDMIFGMKLDANNLPQAGYFSDSFFVDEKDIFSLQQHSLLDFGWFNSNYFIKKKELEKVGVHTFGIRSFRPKVNLVTLIKLILDNIKCWLELSFKDISFWSPLYQLRLITFCKSRFMIQISFEQIKPSVYFSRMDYSYNHHVIGDVCNKNNIYFTGICHSPLGGTGYTPQLSFISFDTYYIYTPLYSKKFFPSWNNEFTKLVSVGVWRSDFIYQSKLQNGHIVARRDVRESLGNRFVVGLHLPVPQAFMFNEETTTKWMNLFSSINDEYQDVAFILFHRRLYESPNYFHQLIEDLISPGKCELADVLNPNWKQSYPWASICDLIIGCTFSDVVLEALACGIPAFSYSDTGQGISELEKIDKSLAIYDGESLSKNIALAKKKKWPSTRQWSEIDKLVGNSRGHCITQIKKNLSKYIEIKEYIS